MAERRVELVFDEYPDDAISLRISPVPMRAYFDFVETGAAIMSYEAFRARVATFVELAAPIRSSGGTFEDLDLAVIKATMNHWTDQISEVPPPLPVGSSVTGPSPERSTPKPANASRHRRNSSAHRHTPRSSGSTPATP